MFRNWLKRTFGSKEFFLHTLQVAVPIMIQNGITNFVGMLDNIMVGQVGTNQMSGVSIVNQLMFVFNLMIFGGLAGIGIFTAQYAGKGDQEGIRYTVRLKFITALVLVTAAMTLFLTLGPTMVSFWLQGEAADAGAKAETLAAARSYLDMMLVGLVPFAASQIYSSTLRENGETVVPMKAGVAAVIVNLIGNYILIYGKFGAPKLGVVGAAAATVISRFVEAGIVIWYTHHHADQYQFIHGLFRGFHIPGRLAGQILIKALPLLANETMWSLGMTMISQQYSRLGLDVVAAFNISNTIANVFNICFIAMGESTAIIIGQALGQGNRTTVRDDAWRLARISVSLCLISGALMISTAWIFPDIYNTTASVKHIATGLIIVSAFCMPLYAFENATYFTLRSGGKTFITFLFDSVFVWVVCLPAVFLLTHFTSLTILPVFILVQFADVIKCVIGYFMVKSGMWVNDLTAV